MARAALRDDVYAEQASLTAHVVRSGANGQPARELVESWLRGNAAAVERSRQVLADIRSGGALDLARLSVAVRELRNLIQSSGAAQVSAEPATAPPSA
jgi:glutamate dehydrogenase